MMACRWFSLIVETCLLNITEEVMIRVKNVVYFNMMFMSGKYEIWQHVLPHRAYSSPAPQHASTHYQRAS